MNQDLLDDIEEPEEPAVEPDNDEFSIDLSEEEEEEEEEDPMYEEDPDQEAPEQIDADQLSDAETTRTSRSHQSRPRQQTGDIYSRQYRPNPRRSEPKSELIASEDDLDMLDDEGDFELNEEEEEEELEEEEEEDEEDLLDDEEAIESFEDSDEEKPKPRPRRAKPAPKKPKEEPEQNLTLVDTEHYKRKPRVYTKDVEDPSAVVSNPVCAFCGQPDDASLGGFLRPVPFINKEQRVFAHLACALSSLEVARSASSFYNVIKAVNKAKKIRCAACHQYGASLVCCITGCLK